MSSSFARKRYGKSSSKKFIVLFAILVTTILIVLLWQLGFFDKMIQAFLDWWNGIGKIFFKNIPIIFGESY